MEPHEEFAVFMYSCRYETPKYTYVYESCICGYTSAYMYVNTIMYISVYVYNFTCMYIQLFKSVYIYVYVHSLGEKSAVTVSDIV